MAVLQLISLLCIVGVFAYGKDDLYDEPKCYSRFDYDHKVLTKLVTLETAVTLIQDATKFETATRGSVVSGEAEQCYYAQCPNAWIYFHGSCYLFEDSVNVDWTEASHYCSGMHNSHLVTIETKAEDLFIKDHAQKLFRNAADRSKLQFWCGAIDKVVEGLWIWYTDDSELDQQAYSFWAPGQPDGSNAHDEDCAALSGSLNITWHDFTCAYAYLPLCELELPLENGEIIG